MFKKSVLYFLIISFSVTLFSCSSYQKIQKSNDFQLKYDKAMEYYDREDYYKALNLFDQVMPFFRGTDKAEDMSFKYAYAYFYQKDFILASYYFDRFSKTYPRSKKTEECSYMSAYCKYLQSPVYTLDQTTTYEALKELQAFMNMFPSSEYLPRCNELIDELRHKLEKKAFEISKLYLKMNKYKAAVSSFENLLNDYPDTQYREDALFYTIKSYYYYASKSIKSKRKERYHEAIETYNDFIALYPNSEHMRDVKYMKKRADKELDNQ